MGVIYPDFMVSMSNLRLTAAVPEGSGQGAGPTVQFLAGAGEGSTVLGEGIARGVGTDRQGTDRQGTGRQGTGRQVAGIGKAGQQVAGTGEAAHLNLWTNK